MPERSPQADIVGRLTDTGYAFLSPADTAAVFHVDLAQLDRVLTEYGPEAAPLRTALRGELDPLIDSIWKENAAGRTGGGAKPHEQSVLYMIRSLSPKSEVQVSLRARALQLSTDLTEIQLSVPSGL